MIHPDIWYDVAQQQLNDRRKHAENKRLAKQVQARHPSLAARLLPWLKSLLPTGHAATVKQLGVPRTQPSAKWGNY